MCKNKTFAEKLREHTKYLEEMGNEIKIMLSQAKKEKENGNIEESERFLTKADELMQVIDTKTQEFENNHKNELMTMEIYFS